MSSNFLSLNPSKTEFLVFSLLQQQQLSKLNNPILFIDEPTGHPLIHYGIIIIIIFIRTRGTQTEQIIQK